MTSAIQKNSKNELHMLRKLMRNQSVTQATISAHLGCSQSHASRLIRELVRIGHAREDGKTLNSIGRLNVLQYALTDKYLAKLRPCGEAINEPRLNAVDACAKEAPPKHHQTSTVEAPVKAPVEVTAVATVTAAAPIQEELPTAPVAEIVTPPERSWSREARGVFSAIAPSLYGAAFAFGVIWASNAVPGLA